MKVKHLVVAMLVLSCLVSVAWAKGSKGGGSTAVLTEGQAEDIIFLREEEKLARDVYLALGAQYGTSIFVNISASEQRHMDSVEKLIDKYGLVDPVTDDTPGFFTNPDIVALYNELMEKGELSLLDALEVGVIIEEMDIADLEEMLDSPETTQADVIRVLTNLLSGSENHLDAFNSALEIY